MLLIQSLMLYNTKILKIKRIFKMTIKKLIEKEILRDEALVLKQ